MPLTACLCTVSVVLIERHARMIVRINPRIALLFLRTRVALGIKKAPKSLSRRTTNLFVSNCTLGVSTMSSSKKVIARTTDNRK